MLHVLLRMFCIAQTHATFCRAAVLSWLSEFGAGSADVSIQIPDDYMPEAVPRTSGGQGRKPMKRRAVDAGEMPPRRRTGYGRPPQDENGISSEVQVPFFDCGPTASAPQ